MASVASDADWAQLDPDFKAGKKALRAENWNGAIAAFELAALRDPTNADIQNYIGYAYRRLRQMGPAIGHYQKALMLNSRHRSAHEHLGEAYLVLGEPAKAQQLLAALENLCLHSLRGIRRPQAGHCGVQKSWPRAEIRSQRELTSLFTAGVPRGAVSHGVSDEMLRTLIAAVDESVCGTFRKWWSRYVMSAVGGRPEVAQRMAETTQLTIADLRRDP